MRRILWLLIAAAVGLVGWWVIRLLLDTRRQQGAVPSVPAEPDSPIGRFHAGASGAQSAPEESSTKELAKKASKKPAKKAAPSEPVRKTTAPKKTAAKKSAAKTSEPKKKPASDQKPKSP